MKNYASKLIVRSASKGIQASCTGMTAEEYEAAARAVSTTKEYAKDLRYFVRDGGVLPASEQNVIEWLTALASSTAPATIRRRMVAINAWHKEHGCESAISSPRVKRVFAGICRTVGTKQRSVTPLLRDDLLSVLASVERQRPMAAARDSALLLVAFSSALRRSNLVQIKIEHLMPHDLGMDIFIPRSKTDGQGRGRTVSVPFAIGDKCPVTATAYWLALSGIDTGYLFRSVNKHDQVGVGNLDVGSVGRIIKRAVALSGRDAGEYSSHSGRAGFVTSAATVGMPAFQIAQVTGHSGLSSLQKYMRVVEQRRVRSLI